MENMGLPSPVKTWWWLGTVNDTIDKVRRSLDEVVIGPLDYLYDAGRGLPFESQLQVRGLAGYWGG